MVLVQSPIDLVSAALGRRTRLRTFLSWLTFLLKSPGVSTGLSYGTYGITDVAYRVVECYSSFPVKGTWCIDVVPPASYECTVLCEDVTWA